MAIIDSQLQVSLGNPDTGLVQSFGDLSNGLGNPDTGLVQSFGDLSNGLGNPEFCTSILTCQQHLPTGNFVNYYSGFARFFGVNATQTATHLTIQKNDLPLLNTSANNTAEALFIALLLRVMLHESNSFISSVVISEWRVEFDSVNNTNIVRSILLIQLFGTPRYQYVGVELLNLPITPANIL